MKPRSRRLTIVVDRKASLIPLALALLVGGAGLLSSQQLTMTATYPIPAGVYNQIVTTGDSGSSPANTSGQSQSVDVTVAFNAAAGSNQ